MCFDKEKQRIMNNLHVTNRFEVDMFKKKAKNNNNK